MTEQPHEHPMCVPPKSVSLLWPDVAPMIEAAYAEVDEFPPDNLREAFILGRLLLWVSVSGGKVTAVLVTALLKRPSGLVCKLMVAAGVGAGQWAAWHGRIESYARAEGCVKLFSEGRPGWARILPGYTAKRFVLEKRL